MRLKSHPHIRFAGQITGVEGYVESAAMGLLAGRMAAAEIKGATLPPPPPETAMGALVTHITGGAEAKTFQPMNVNFGLFPPIDAKGGRRGRKDRYKAYTDRAKAGLHSNGFRNPLRPLARPAPCIWAMPIPRSSRMTWPAPRAAASCCGSRISTSTAAARNGRAPIHEDLRWLGLTWDGPIHAPVRPHRQPTTPRWKPLGRHGPALPLLLHPRATSAPRCPPRRKASAGSAVYPGTCRGRSHGDAALPGDAAAGWTWPAGALQALAGAPTCSLSPKPARPTQARHRIDPDAGPAPDRRCRPVAARARISSPIILAVGLRRCRPGHHPCDPRRGSVRRHADPRHPAAPLRPADAVYHHHRLIRDDQGKRLAKRDDARAISQVPGRGRTPADIRRMVGLPNLNAHAQAIVIAASQF